MQHASLNQGFRIDDTLIEPAEGTLTRADGQSIHLEPKVMEVLLTLARAGDRTVSRADLLDTVWNGQAASDELLTRAISEIRRALGDDPRQPKYIRTVPKRGYRLLGGVEPLEPPRIAATTHNANRTGRVAGLAAAAVLLVVGYQLSNDVLDSSDSTPQAAGTDAQRASISGRPRPLTSTEGYEWSPALSPDGNYAAFVASPLGTFKVGDIHVVEVGSAMPVPLTNDADAGNRAPTWSPDGMRIAFARSLPEGGTEIVIKPVLGGFERRLATVDIFWGHEWSPNGEQLAVAVSEDYHKSSRIHLLSVSDGSFAAFTHPPDAMGDYHPRFSPDGRMLAFLRRGVDSAGAELCLKPLSDTPVNCITPKNKQWPIRDFAWSPSGESLIVSVDGLLRVPISGAPIEPLPFGDNAYNVAAARSANRLVYERFIEDSNLWRVPGPAAATQGAPERLIASTRAELLPRYSPDGSKIAFVSGRTGGWEVWIANADGSSPRRLTEWGFAAFPDWSPDGRLITFSSGRYAVGRGEQAITDVGSDPDEAFSIEAAGGVPRMISDGESGARAPSWSADGQYVFFTRGFNDCGSEALWRRQVDSGEEAKLSDCAWRPLAGDDGRVYFFDKAGRSISSVSASGGSERPELVFDAECDPLSNAWTVWRSNLVYVDCEDLVIKMLDMQTGVTSELVAPFAKEQLFEFSSLDVSPDGEWILFSRLDRAASDLILIDPFR